MSESATQRLIPAGIEIHCGYEPGIVGRVGELHGRYYAAAWPPSRHRRWKLQTRDDDISGVILPNHISNLPPNRQSAFANRQPLSSGKLRFLLYQRFATRPAPIVTM